LKEYDTFAKRLARAKDTGTVPPKIQHIIWEEALKVTMEQLVDGYAKIKKVTRYSKYYFHYLSSFVYLELSFLVHK
jgi:hypothetical protein